MNGDIPSLNRAREEEEGRERERERAAQEEEALDDLCVKERESATVRQAIIGAASAATLVKTSERDGAERIWIFPTA